jgi:hypothetical protein
MECGCGDDGFLRREVTKTIKGLFLVRDLALEGAATQRRFTKQSQGEESQGKGGLRSEVTVGKMIS